MENLSNKYSKEYLEEIREKVVKSE